MRTALAILSIAGETRNLAEDAAHASTVAKLKARVRAYRR
jgi:hypothetical protein